MASAPPLRASPVPAPQTRFLKHHDLNKAHMRGQRTLFNGRRFSFLTATGKNINTGGAGGGKAARARAPGPGSGKEAGS